MRIAFSEDLSLIPSTYIRQLIAISRGADASGFHWHLLSHPDTCTHTCTHTHTHTHTQLKMNNYLEKPMSPKFVLVGLAQWVKVIAAKPDSLSSIPRTQMMERSNCHRLSSDK